MSTIRGNSMIPSELAAHFMKREMELLRSGEGTKLSQEELSERLGPKKRKHKLKKHTRDKHIIKRVKFGGRLLEYHATKGWRSYKDN